MKKVMTISIFLMVSVISHAATETIGGYTWTYNTQVSFENYLASITEVTPKTGDVIVPSVFEGESATPWSVNSIREDLFNGSEITSVTVLDGVKVIGERCFANCSSLQKIVLPSSVNNIGQFAFKDCSNLKDVTWPGSFQMGYAPSPWGYYIMKDMSSITNITVSEGSKEIVQSCLAQCVNVVKVTIPEGVTNIADGAMSGCCRLGEIKLPTSLQYLGGGVFADCYSLSNVMFMGDAPTCEHGIFGGANRDLVVYVPVGSKGWDGNPESTALPKYWPFNTEGGRRIVHIGETVNDEPSVVTNYVYSTVTNYIHTTVTNEVFHYSTVTNEVHHHTTDEIHHYSTVTNEVFHYTTVTNELFHYSTVTNEIQNYMTVTNELHHYETVTNEVQNHSAVTNVMHVYTTVTNVVEYVPEPGTSPDAGYTIRAGEDVVLTIVGAAGWDAFGVPDGMTWDRTAGRLSGCVKRSGIYDLLLVSGSGADTRIMRTTITVIGGAGEGGNEDPLSEPIKIVGGDLVNGTMTFSVELDSLPDLGNGLAVISEALPTNVQFKVTGGKKLDAGKAALLKYQKVKVNGVDRYELIGLNDASRPNVSGIKLAYTPKTGLLKGFFTMYASDAANLAAGVKPKLKKYKVAITGVVVNGVGIGQATMTKPAAGPWAIELR